MSRWLVVIVIAALAGVGLWYSEHRAEQPPVRPDALLNAAADAQRGVTRIPMQVTRLSDAEEVAIGNQLAGGIQRSSDPAAQVMQAYVQQVGAKVAARAHRKLTFHFYYDPDPGFVNAYALPGGHIVIGEGLIRLMDSEDELAGVLGHEVEHVDHYHCVERLQVEAQLRKLPLGDLARITTGLPLALFQAGYTKEQEFEADIEGTRLANWAGYSPQGPIRMFEAFERYEREYVTRASTPQQELSKVAIEGLKGYFRSHPRSAERKQRIREASIRERWPMPPERPLNRPVTAATTTSTPVQ